MDEKMDYGEGQKTDSPDRNLRTALDYLNNRKNGLNELDEICTLIIEKLSNNGMDSSLESKAISGPSNLVEAFYSVGDGIEGIGRTVRDKLTIINNFI